MKQFGTRLTGVVFLVAAALAACGGHGGAGAVVPQSQERRVSGMLPAATASPPPYCAGIAPLPSGVTLNLTDDSGLKAILVVYVTNGAQFMTSTGSFTSAAPVPLPATCFPTAFAKTYALKIPSGVGGGRIYLAYAIPNPSQPKAVPNPLAGTSISGPQLGYGYTTFPWDKIEYATTSGATIDTTQVDALGLPLELSVAKALPVLPPVPSPFPSVCPTHAPPIVGVTTCNYAKIFGAMENTPPYNSLVLTQQFAGKLLDLQIVSPKDAVSFTAFPWNLFGDRTLLPSPRPNFCPTAAPSGYLSCVISAYNTGRFGGRRFGTNGIGASNVSGDNYCVYSNGKDHFLFADIGPATACDKATPNPNVSPNPFKMPVQEFTYGVPPAADGGGGCKQNILLSQPWGNANVGAGHIFATNDAFALWKGLSSDLNRGTMMSTGGHPVGITSPKMSDFFKNPVFNEYAYIMHTYFNNNLAYAIAYDDLGNFESGVIWYPGDSINVRVNTIPQAAQAIPQSSPVPTPVPSPCTTLRPDVGSF